MKNLGYCIYLILIFLIQGCSFTANISILAPESAYVYIATSKVTLKSSYFAQTDQVTFSTEDCEDYKQYLVTESVSLVPLGHETEWQSCSLSTNEINYQLSSSTIGSHAIYIWGKNSKGQITTNSQRINIKYVPQILFGQSDVNSDLGYQVGLYDPLKIEKIGTKYYVVNKTMYQISVYNSEPSSGSIPNLILGQKADRTQSQVLSGNNRFGTPYYFTSDGTRFVATDYENHRVLIWNTIPTSSDTPADIVLGQNNFTDKIENRGKGITTDLLNCGDLYRPVDAQIVGDSLAISDYGNNRILIWNTWPTSNGQAADIVLGQASCSAKLTSPRTSSSLYAPMGLAWDGTHLLVADSGNNRVLIWNSFPTSNAQVANLVLGQTSFTIGTLNAGLGNPTASTLYSPKDVTSDGTNVVVADSSNHRVLIWNSFPTTNAQTANTVVGQPDFVSMTSNQDLGITAQTLNAPYGVTLIDGNLWVADTSNHRIVKYSGIPSSNNVAATSVLGKSNVNDLDRTVLSKGITSLNLSRPYDIHVEDDQVYVSDWLVHRFMKFNTHSISPTTEPDLIWGQSNATSSMYDKNLGDTNQGGFNSPSNILKSSNYLFVADSSNNRVLIWNTIPSSHTDLPNVVLGHADFVSKASNDGGVSASSIFNPRSIATDGTRLAVVDQSNHRVLIWNSIPTSNNQAANLIIGQPDATSNTANNGGLSASSLNTPSGVAFADGKLIVCDSLNSRILIWNTLPTTHGQAADLVLGQDNMTSTKNYNGLSTLKPNEVVYKFGKLIVVDRFALSIKIWDSIPTTNNQLPDRQIGLSLRPQGMAEYTTTRNAYTINDIYNVDYDGSRIWLVDYGGARIVTLPFPEVSIAAIPYTNQNSVVINVHSCDQRTQVLFNEGTTPTGDEDEWEICTTVKESYSYSFSSGQGLKEIKAWFKDSNGHVVPTAHRMYLWYDTVNDLPPQISYLTSPTNGTTPTLTFGNTGRNLTTARYFISETSTPVPNGNETSWITDTTYSYTMTDLTNGVRNLYVWSMDPAGNVSQSPSTLQFTLDTVAPTAPTATLTGFYAATYNTVARVTASSCADIDKVMFTESTTAPTASDTGWTTCSTTANGLTYTLTGATEGNHTLYLWSKDTAGNISASGTALSFNFNSSLVLGQANANEVETASVGFSRPQDISSNGSQFVVTDTYNGRVLIYNGDPISNSPAVVLGQDLMSKIGYRVGVQVSATNLAQPGKAIIVGTKLIVSDSSQHRVLIWNTIPTVNNQTPDVVLGQPDFVSATANNGGISCATLSNPIGLDSDGTRLFVVDYNNHRVLVWNTIPTSNFSTANFVIGQSSCTGKNPGTTATSLSNPYDISARSSKIVIADQSNNRVLIYNSITATSMNDIPVAGISADYVIGQTNMTSGSTNAGGGTTSCSQCFDNPRNVFVDNEGILYVSDISSHRILIFNSVPTSDNATANLVLGQADFTSTSDSAALNRFNVPRGIYANNNYVWVTDSTNHQIKRFAKPLTTGASATHMVGSTDPATASVNAKTSTTTLNSELFQPQGGIIVGTKMLIADTSNHRILIWNSIPTSSNQSADVVIGHNDLTTMTENDPSVTTQAGRLSKPTSVVSDGTKLFVSDTGNHRVLVFNTIPTSNGALADNVFGQTDMTNIGKNKSLGVISSSSLNGPTYMALNGNQFFVSDTGNHRVLVWNNISTITDAMAANFALGQANTSSGSANRGSASATSGSMYYPLGVSIINTKLYIADSTNHRILVWTTIPTALANAANVIGQTSTSGKANATTATGLYSPSAIKYCNNKFFVVDRANYRINVYNSIPTANGPAVDSIIGQASATTLVLQRGGLSAWTASYPTDLICDGTSFWVIDRYDHRLVKLTLPY